MFIVCVFVCPQQEVRDDLLKEVDKERMMRLGTEQRLLDMQLESDSCRARLQTLQEEFRKMEEMVANMLQYKVKIDQLKQENASMKTSYENNLQKYCTHISTLERDNMLLRNQVKKMEAQVHGKGDERDKTKLLLERLKMVEAENSSLVLENEQQRQQYEKCLDEIANQVVQALLAQKTLREECLKLQTRVQDLELQNKHLNMMFKQRLRITSDSVLQVQHTSCITTNHLCRTTVTENANGDLELLPGDITLEFLNNAESLQSMCSELIGDDSPGKPQLSSPPPWLKDKPSLPGDGDSNSSTTSSSTSTTSPESPPENKDGTVLTKIETEFPANNSSPKVKHIRVVASRTRSLERESMRTSCWQKSRDKGDYYSRRCSETEKSCHPRTSRLKQSTSADGISHYGIGNKVSPSLITDSTHWKTSSHDRLAPQSLLMSLPADSGPAVLLAGADFNHKSFEAFNKNFEKLLAKNTCEEKITSQPKSALPGEGEQPSTVQFKSSLNQSQHHKVTPSQKSEKGKSRSSPSAPLRNPFTYSHKTSRSPSCVQPGQYYYYDYSDEDSDSRPVSRDFSTASTMSLNELLDSSLEGEVAIDDDFFSDWSSVCISPRKRIENMTGVAISNLAMQSKLHSSTPSSGSRSTSSSPESSGVPVKVMPSALKYSKSKQVSHLPSDSPPAVKTSHDLDLTGENRQNSSVQGSRSSDRSENNVPKNPVTANSSTQQTKSNTTLVSVEVHAENQTINFLPSSSPSPNLSQKSDLGYGSKGSYSQSSSSPSPSITQRAMPPPWLQSTKDPHSYTRNELLSLVISKDTPGANPKSAVPGCLNSSPSPKLVRPGQLILAPQDKNFSFQGFSSASSTSSEDKSPLKIFESKHSSDMKSSVIEVKKDGTFVHTVQSLGDSGSENSSSMSGSPLSPVKLASKIPPPVAQKPTRAVRPEARLSQSTQDTNGNEKYVGNKNNNITVGFLLHDGQPFSGHSTSMDNFITNAMKDSKCKSMPRASTDFGGIPQTKCQSSDSSFENLKVERSGSKDDGYSTMSSDIHPEVLEKFSDTLTRKYSETEVEQSRVNLRFCGHEVDVSHNDRQHSDLTTASRDRSFDLTSDPDSALETSVHSTAEMVTSSSSQISTSSSDFPLSPCASKVSKIAKLFDAENTRVNYIHGLHNAGQCNTTSQNSKGMKNSNASTPGSPNAVISPFQQPESPRRLANEFQKNNRTCNSPVSFLKISPGSPKSINCFNSPKSLASSQSQSGIPILTSAKKTGEVKPVKPDSPIPSCANSKRLPRGFYNSPISKNTARTAEKQASKQEAVSDIANHPDHQISVSRVPVPSQIERESSNLGEANTEKKFSGKSPMLTESINSVSLEKKPSMKNVNKCEMTEVVAQKKGNTEFDQEILVKSNCKSKSIDTKNFMCEINSKESNCGTNPKHEERNITPRIMREANLLPVKADHQRKRPCVILTNQFYQQFSSDSDTTEEEKDSNFIPCPSLVIPSQFNVTPRGGAELLPACSDVTSNGERDTRSGSTVQDVNSSDTSREAVSSIRTLAASESMHHMSSNASLHQSRLCSASSNLSYPSTQLPHTDNISIQVSRKLCLPRSKSEQCLSSSKWRQLSAHDDQSRWDSCRILERSTSMSELDRLHKISFRQQTSGPHDWLLFSSPYNENCSGFEGRQFPWNLPLAPLPSHSAPNKPRQTYPQKQQQHSGTYYLYSPCLQTLCLDLSDVTELDEDGSELATTRESLDSSLALNGANMESPRLVGDEQKLFNSQFYSLCKVDSSRSLLSSGNESRDKSSLTSLNELVSGKSIDGSGADTHLTDVEDEIAIREFDEISRQIAGLSKTVDELNQSLSSLNSGEFEPTSHHVLVSSPRPPSGGTAPRVDVIDGYHWVDDEFFLTSCNGEIIVGSGGLAKEDSFNDIFTHSSSFDLNSTEDATEEFYRVPLHKMRGLSSQSEGQDEIFAGSYFDTVREKPHLRKEDAGLEKCSGDLGEEGRGVKPGEDDVGREHIQEAVDPIEFLNGSNNDSDDSLASDIGLDHMMCQRLFGSKDSSQAFSAASSKPALDFSTLLKRYDDPGREATTGLDLSTTESAVADAKSMLKQWSLEQKGNDAHIHEKSAEAPTTERNVCLVTPAKETRDVGIDAMSQSQRSLSTSFETFDQFVSGVESTDMSERRDTEMESPHDMNVMSQEKADKIQQRSSSGLDWKGVGSEIISHGSCESNSSSLPSQLIKRFHHQVLAGDSPASYSDFVADLKSSAAVNENPPPKLPPRSPIITNGSLHISLERDILPPPPLCLNNETCHHALPIQHSHSRAVLRPHSPYVNQQHSALVIQRTRLNPRPLSDSAVSVSSPHHLGRSIPPPPLPPRQPQISRTLDGRPQVMIRPHCIQQDVQAEDSGLPPFQHYLINKHKANVQSPSPTSLCTFPRPRSLSETLGFGKHSGSLTERVKEDPVTPSRIPRRKLKTRRELSKLKQNSDRSSLEAAVKSPDTSVNNNNPNPHLIPDMDTCVQSKNCLADENSSD
ncbi:hypothetical protein Btru_047720 [Bulinus truncatus]|nr:hypothetical protein Btru_047720 [Bulinus truncatus]